MNSWSVPAIILAIMSILGLLFKINRSFINQDALVSKHDELYKKCSSTKVITEQECKKSQKECKDIQSNENKKILKAINDMSIKFEARQQVNQNELMKINKALGRIEGQVGRRQFDE